MAERRIKNATRLAPGRRRRIIRRAALVSLVSSAVSGLAEAPPPTGFHSRRYRQTPTVRERGRRKSREKKTATIRAARPVKTRHLRGLVESRQTIDAAERNGPDKLAGLAVYLRRRLSFPARIIHDRGRETGALLSPPGTHSDARNEFRGTGPGFTF